MPQFIAISLRHFTTHRKYFGKSIHLPIRKSGLFSVYLFDAKIAIIIFAEAAELFPEFP